MTPRLPLILCLALLALPAALHGQQGARFDVTVVDSAGAPVANARVEIAGVGVGATTNERGVGRIDRVPAGNRIVSASRIGYTAANLLMDELEAEPHCVKPKQIVLPVDLVVRQSTAPPPGA